MFFGEKGESLESLLSGIDRITLCNVCLSILYHPKAYSYGIRFIENFFGSNHSKFSNFVVERFLLFAKNNNDLNPSQLSFVTELTMLSLLRLAFSLPPQCLTVSQEVLEEKIFRAILVVNENILPDSEPNINNDTSIDEFAIYIATSLLPYADLVFNKSEERILTQTVKAGSFFKFCCEDTTYNALLQDFLRDNNFESWKSYLKCFLELSLYCVKEPDHNGKVIVQSKKHNPDLNPNTLSNFSFSVDSIIPLNDNLDFKYFREHPLIRITDERYMIISPVFCANKLYDNLKFAFREINDRKNPKPVKDIFGDYSARFSEPHLFYTTIENIFLHKNYVKLSGKRCREISTEDGEPDYYVRNGNKIFLFEYKDSLFNGECKTSYDTNKVSEYLTQKLINKSPRSSAIEQLLNNIVRIAEGNFVWDTGFKSCNARITPILVVDNDIFTTQGISHFLDVKLQSEIKLKNIYIHVDDLILVSNDTLLKYQFHFQSKRLDFCCVISDYLKYSRLNNSQDKIILNFLGMQNECYSFDDFLNQTYKLDGCPQMKNLLCDILQ